MVLFVCDKCEFNTTNRFDYIRHLNCNKHLKNININNNLEDKPHICVCGMKYKHKTSLNRHYTRSCSYYISNIKNENLLLFKKLNELENEKKENEKKILEKLENKVEELQKVLLLTHSQVQTINNTTNHTTNNSINFNFNYLFALNEKFPDALTMSEFMSLVEDSLGDLTKMSTRPSFIDQVSGILCNKISELNTQDRPLHYIESNEGNSFYIKEGGQWDKTTNEFVTNKLKYTARSISKIRNDQWEEKLNSGEEQTQTSDKWVKFIKHISTEITPEDLEKGVKRLKKVTKLNKELLL